MEGIEPTTLRLQITRSGHLSYIGSISMPFTKGLQRYTLFWNLQKLLKDFFHAFFVQSPILPLLSLRCLRHELITYADRYDPGLAAAPGKEFRHRPEKPSGEGAVFHGDYFAER